MVAGRGRIGQKNKITRRWAGAAPGPSAAATSALIGLSLGAICPKEGKGAGCLPCNSESMDCTDEIRTPSRRHAVLLLDQAGCTPAKRSPTTSPPPPTTKHKHHNKTSPTTAARLGQAVDRPWTIMSIGIVT